MIASASSVDGSRVSGHERSAGIVMILALVVLATYNDLSRFWKSMLESVVGIFQ